MMNFKNSVIYLNSFPGTGKLTIAKEICKQANVILYDNHTVNNVLFSLFTPEQRKNLRSERLLWDRRRDIYDIVFEVFRKHVPRDNNYVFTGTCMQEKPEAVDFYERFKALHAGKREALFLPVELTCDLAELKKRVVTPERAEYYKLTDPDILEDVTKKHTLVDLQHPNKMTLDVTALPPEKSAKAILDQLTQLYS
jgi:hypothetical protein